MSDVIEKIDIKMTDRDQKDILFFHLHSSLGSTLIPPLIRIIIDFARSFWFFGDSKNGMIYDPLTEQTWPFSSSTHPSPHVLLYIHSPGQSESKLLVNNHLTSWSSRIETLHYHLDKLDIISSYELCNVVFSSIQITNQVIATSQSLFFPSENGLLWQRFDLLTQKWKETFDTSDQSKSSDFASAWLDVLEFVGLKPFVLQSIGIGPRSFLVIEDNHATASKRCFTYDYDSDDMPLGCISEIELPMNVDVKADALATGVIREGYDMVVIVLDSQTMLQFNIQSRHPLSVDKPRIVKFQKRDRPMIMMIADSNLWGIGQDKLYKFCFRDNIWIFLKNISPSLSQFRAIIGLV
jgi:hypothetical protein